MISAQDIKKLRDLTGLSISLCKGALEEALGDEAKALAILQSKGASAAEKKAGRTLGAGTVAAYIHATKTMGALIELSSETDFVAKNEEFRALAYDLAMHVCATNPANIETLLAEPFIKDPDKTVRDLVQNAIQKFGERVEISRFSRFSSGA